MENNSSHIRQKKFTLGILIVNYNVGAYLRRCLESISSNVGDIDYVLSIVDNNSHDNSLELLNELEIPMTITRSGKNIGFGRGINLAAKAVEAEFFMILNPDTIVSNDIMSSLLSVLKSHPEVAVVGCPMIDSSNTVQAFSYELPSVMRTVASLFNIKKFLELPYVRSILGAVSWSRGVSSYLCKPVLDGSLRRVSCVPGSGFIIRAEDFRAIGGFDENIFLYMEDCDLFARLLRSNRLIALLHKTGIVHFVSKSFSTSFSSHSPLKHWSTLYYFKKNEPWIRYAMVRIAFTLSFFGKCFFITNRKSRSDLLKTLAISLKGPQSFNPFSDVN